PTPVGPIWDGEVSAISFKSDGELWAWSDRKAGPLIVDLTTGAGERANQSSEADYSQFAIEAMTWDNQDQKLYLAENSAGTGETSGQHSTLYSWNSSDGAINVCPLKNADGEFVIGQIEALDMADNNVLLFAVHEDNDTNIYGWRVEDGGCPVLPSDNGLGNIVLKYDTEVYFDIEAISWPKSCNIEEVIAQQGLEAE
ncbi:MAG: hypothetical protein KAG43_01485, partial [Candidatus Marithrix sp.]|nr:hypothetical protein [Candidatus Marithrix sp.]